MERGVVPSQALVASLLAALREEGVLNFAVVTSVMRRVGERLAEFYGAPPSPLNALRRAYELLQFAGAVSIEDLNEKIVVRVVTKTCRICPKAVGGLELPGRLCPLPGLLSGFAGLKPDLEGTRREGEYCIVPLTYEKKATSP